MCFLQKIFAFALPAPRILEPVHRRIKARLVQHGADQSWLRQCSHGGVFALIAVLRLHVFSFATNFVGGSFPLMTAHVPHLASTLMDGAYGALQLLQ
jgi:hypothetical protein